MTQKYADGKVYSPGTVIISAAGEVRDIRRVNSPVIRHRKSKLILIDFSGTDLQLGGSALYQSLNKIGEKAPEVASAEYFAKAFEAVQTLTERGLILSQHDISAGGLITCLLEMTFANRKGGLRIPESNSLYNRRACHRTRPHDCPQRCRDRSAHRQRPRHLV